MCELKIPKKYISNSLDMKIALTANCFIQFRRRMKLMKKADFVTTTKIYLNESLDIDPSFIANSTELFGLKVDKVGFKYSTAASQFMNKQIEREMLKRVTDVIDANDVNVNTSMVILNAAHYKGTWEKPFYPQLTKDKKFYNLKGEISKTPMMVTMDDVPFLDDPNLDIKMITLPFLQESITFVMPLNASQLPFFIDRIHKDAELMKQLKSRMTRKVLNISIPKFKIKTYVDWTGFLRLIGINQIMNTTYSGLHHMLKRGSTDNVYLSKIKQKIVIELDEFGIRRPRRLEEIQDFKRNQNFMDRADEVLLDRPFYFAISFRDRTGEYDIFQGTYYGPQEI
ncbi:unnamed protein product [Chilo suppressalis]|uniref:Serpin domain-containing protein n=1 Tax=Chilo suppressalis TaxID=168631 RepID=A0ABN8ARM4_CHISP|nr:unnamed protein product [Chilo suppressalis]